MQLTPKALREEDGLSSADRGVWATDDLVLSRVFGIDNGRFGQFYVRPRDRVIELIDWKITAIPKDFIAWTYYLNPREFRHIRDWKYLSSGAVPILRAEKYVLRAELLNHFTIYELQRTKVRLAA